MGAWSHEPFGNDTASDWAYGLIGSDDLSYLEDTLDKVEENATNYLEAPDAEEAIAAIEVLAKLMNKGTQTDSYTKEVDAWVESSKHKPNVALLQKAQRAIDRILADNSELLELWQESDQFSAWKASVTKLRTVVSA